MNGTQYTVHGKPVKSKAFHLGRVNGMLLGIYLIYVLIFTLKPFNFSLHWAELFIHKPHKELLSAKMYDIVGNLLFFIPFGFFLGRYFNHRKNGFGGFFRVTFMGLFFSAAIEAAQIFLPRTTSLIDVLTNTSGTALGYALAFWRIWEHTPVRQAIQIIRTRGFRMLLTVTYAVLLGWFLFQPIRLNRFDNWDGSYPFLLGNEGTDDRPWRGEIRSLLIFDRALTPGEIQTLTIHTVDGVSLPLIAETHPLAAFSFDEKDGETLRNLADGELSLRLSQTGVSLSQSGLRFEDGKVSNFPLARMLTERIKATSRFTLSLWMKTVDVDQTGPARIVSISKNPDRRDFTLGQDGRQLTLRVRTLYHGKNGARMPLFSGVVLEDTLFHHVAVTYDHGVGRFYVDGSPAGRPLYGHRDYLPEWREFGRGFFGWFAFCLSSFFLLSFLVYFIPRRNRVLWTTVILFGFADVIEGLYFFLFGQPVSFYLVLPVLMISLMTGLVVWIIRK